jgi:hypothetical protein
MLEAAGDANPATHIGDPASRTAVGRLLAFMLTGGTLTQIGMRALVATHA